MWRYTICIHINIYILAATLWGLSRSRSLSSAQFGTGVLGLRVPLKAAKWAAAAVGGPLWSPRPMDPHDYDACDGWARLFICIFSCPRLLPAVVI